MYGTTDIIVGGLKGTGNKVINTDFNARGEYQGGPDGCAFDFETGATGFEITGNYFYRSWGAGIMIFGEKTALFEPFIYKMQDFTKTGSGQT